MAVVGERDSLPAKRAVPYLVTTIPGAVGYVACRVGHQWNAEDRNLFSEMVRMWVDSQGIHPALESSEDHFSDSLGSRQDLAD